MIKYDIIPHKFTSSDSSIIFVGNGNRSFGLKVASYFKGSLSNCVIDKFSDGEIKIPKIEENIRKRNCVIIQTASVSTKGTVNDLIMELFVLIDAIRRGSANSITVVLPIYPYQRQDRKLNSRTPISARMIASFLETQQVSRVICFDLHAGQIQGFFDTTPLDNLYTEPYFIRYIDENLSDVSKDDLMIISPDEGGMKKAVRMSEKLGCDCAIIYKERKKSNKVDKMVLMGDVKDKVCFIVDDMVDTFGTAQKACNILIENGASRVFFGACHGVLSGPAIDRINNSEFERVVLTNTVEIEERFPDNKKIDVIDVSEMMAHAIDRSITGNSLSELMTL